MKETKVQKTNVRGSTRKHSTQSAYSNRSLGIHPTLSTNLEETNDFTSYLPDDSTRKLVRTAHFEAERWRLEAYRLRFSIS